MQVIEQKRKFAEQTEYFSFSFLSTMKPIGIEGRMKGKATRGRKRLDMLSDFKTTTGDVEVKRAAKDRSHVSAKR